MNEVELVTQLRAEVPLTERRPRSNMQSSGHAGGSGRSRALSELAASAASGGRCGRSAAPLRRQSCPVAERVAAASQSAVAVPAAARSVASRRPRCILAAPALQRNSSITRPGRQPPRPHVPAPHDWIYVKAEYAQSTAGSGGFLFGPPNERDVGPQWIRADWRSTRATCRPPRLQSRWTGGTLGGWKSISPSYLNSLPTVPAKLEAIILAEQQPADALVRARMNVGDIQRHLDAADRTAEGSGCRRSWRQPCTGSLPAFPGCISIAPPTWQAEPALASTWCRRLVKQELVINPVSYTYMGRPDVAIRAHESVATDGTRR